MREMPFIYEICANSPQSHLWAAVLECAMIELPEKDWLGYLTSEDGKLVLKFAGIDFGLFYKLLLLQKSTHAA